MAVMKYKDSDGTWKELPGAVINTIIGNPQLKIDVIARKSVNTYDLTKYQNCNRFVMFYTADETFGSGNSVICVFDSECGNDTYMYMLRKEVGDDTTGLKRLAADATGGDYNTGWDYAIAKPQETGDAGIGTTNANMANMTSYRNGIFTFLNQKDNYVNAGAEQIVGEYAIVIYAE